MSSRAYCPFCRSPGRDGKFICGTQKVPDSDVYRTGNECDKNCFRNAYIRCLDLLQRVVDEDPRSDLPEDLIGEIEGELGIESQNPLTRIKKLYDENEGR